VSDLLVAKALECLRGKHVALERRQRLGLLHRPARGGGPRFAEGCCRRVTSTVLKGSRCHSMFSVWHGATREDAERTAALSAIHPEVGVRYSPHQASTAASAAPERSLQIVLASLEDSKAEDTTTIDIAAKTAIGDHMVVTTGRSHRHVGAIADHLVKDLKAGGVGPVRVEGLPHCDWVLVDVGDVIVHIFRTEVRSFYGLEKMWMAGFDEQRARA
jgi:ribosome-associated protein